MKTSPLGTSTLHVTPICLGSMTWGQQNTEADAHAQLDYALSRGINFIDTAEMYSVPVRAETYGATEKIIGTWLKKHGAATRERVCSRPSVLAPREARVMCIGCAASCARSRGKTFNAA